MLLDCSFLDLPSLAQQVYWTYGCKQSTYFNKTGRVEACKSGFIDNYDILAIRRHCRESSLRLLKTIRFHTFNASFSAFMAMRAWDTRVIHLVRNPWHVLRSQIVAGWHGDHLDEVHFSRISHVRCRNMTATHQYLHAAVPDSRLLVVRYEDMMLNPSGKLSEIMQFLNRNCSEICSHNAVRKILSTKHAHLSINTRAAASIQDTWENITKLTCSVFNEAHSYT